MYSLIGLFTVLVNNVAFHLADERVKLIMVGEMVAHVTLSRDLTLYL
jgi:hypothetical protein